MQRNNACFFTFFQAIITQPLKIKPTPMKKRQYIPCGAKLRSGQACAKPPIAGHHRCRLHGGITKTNGADSVTANLGGLYSKFYTPDELADLHEMELGNVDFEIKLVRLRLARAMKMEEQDAAGELKPLLESRIERVGGGPLTVPEERHYRKVDYRAAINLCLARIESLEKTRAELAKLASSSNSEDLITALTNLADRLPA